ncbi:Fic family protein [Candidatus Uhrbacteria bacterium]|nr:Fic family protein [Candidatus Uhrbacteria bacterium]
MPAFDLERAARFIYHSNLMEFEDSRLAPPLDEIRRQLAANPRPLHGHAGSLCDVMELAADKMTLHRGDLRQWQRQVVREHIALEAGVKPEESLPPELAAKVGWERDGNLSQGKIGVDHAQIDVLLERFIQAHRKFLSEEAWSAPDVIDFAADSHRVFERIHPFWDGNGRIGRLAVNYILAFYGLPIAVFPSDERDSLYVPAVTAADDGPMRAYLRRCLPEGVAAVGFP